MADKQYKRLDKDNLDYLVILLLTRLKGSPLNNNTTYTFTQDATDANKILISGSDGTSTTLTIPAYDPTLMESRVKSNQNNIQALIDELMNITTYYIVDSDGKILIDSNGFPLISATYYSKLDELQKSINELLARKYVYSDETYDEPNG